MGPDRGRPSIGGDCRSGADSGQVPGDLKSGIQLVHIGYLELQHPRHPVVRIPAECCAEDLLVVAIDIAGDTLRHAGNDVAVLVCDAPAGGEFPCADAALIEGKRVIDLGPGERGIPSTERIDSPVMTQPAST
jgi:hypothetical protein